MLLILTPDIGDIITKNHGPIPLLVPIARPRFKIMVLLMVVFFPPCALRIVNWMMYNVTLHPVGMQAVCQLYGFIKLCHLLKYLPVTILY